jgi:Flp pilus assembly protein TadG
MTNLLYIPKRPLAVLDRLVQDRRGATAVMLAVALTGIIGFAGLGSEVASWYFTTRSMQVAADSAAASAAAELAAATLSGSSISSDQLVHTGRAIAASSNFTNGVSSTTVSVNNPPGTTTGLTTCSSPFTSFNCYVEVVIQQPQTPLLSSLFMSSGPTITTRAVALANTNVTPDGCLVALDSHSGDTGISSSGSPTITLNSCSLIDNSNLSAGGTITAQSAYISEVSAEGA